MTRSVDTYKQVKPFLGWPFSLQTSKKERDKEEKFGREKKTKALPLAF
jgi:hypothetical protein